MSEPLERTSWRGMQTDHPPHWELAVACGPAEPGRIVFADRRYHRLDIRWRPVKFPPNLDLVLEKHKARKSKDDTAETHDLTGAPRPWKGLVKRIEGGTFVHAGRFFKSRRWLVEVILVWPDRRDRKLERAILSSIAAEEPDAPVRFWRAMGLDLSLGREFELHEPDAKIGRVKWRFRTAERGRKAEELTVERIAMPGEWLETPLREWLLEQGADGEALLRQDPVTINSHRGEQALTQGRITPLHSLRGVRRLTLSVAWVCPIEDRMYHIRRSRPSRDADLSLPKALSVRCCKPVPSPTEAEASA